MKRIPVIFLIVLTTYFCVTGQTTASNCPEITVVGPSGITQSGDTMFFAANVGAFDQNGKVEYRWTVSAGAIESGQGTLGITVRSTKEMENSNVTAALKVAGLPAGCKDSASETGSIAARTACGGPMDEFGKLSRDDVKARVDNFYIRLNNDPEAEGLIVVELNEKESRALKLAYVNSIYDGMLFLKRDPSRVTFIVLHGGFETVTKFWVVPRGADFPEVAENPVLIKGEDFKEKIKDIFRPK